jgi:hypothetical protein
VTFIIVYPRGNRSEIAVAESSECEFGDYDRASRETFDQEKEAFEYARSLAKKYGKTFVGDPAYLD